MKGFRYAVIIGAEHRVLFSTRPTVTHKFNAQTVSVALTFPSTKANSPNLSRKWIYKTSIVNPGQRRKIVIRSLKTPTVTLKINGSDNGNVAPTDRIGVSWTSQNVQWCLAEDFGTGNPYAKAIGWSGRKAPTGS